MKDPFPWDRTIGNFFTLLTCLLIVAPIVGGIWTGKPLFVATGAVFAAAIGFYRIVLGIRLFSAIVDIEQLVVALTAALLVFLISPKVLALRQKIAGRGGSKTVSGTIERLPDVSTSSARSSGPPGAASRDRDRRR